MLLNDPLRTGSYGVKKEYSTLSPKADHIWEYPWNFKSGDVDEWEAITQLQLELQDEASWKADMNWKQM